MNSQESFQNACFNIHHLNLENTIREKDDNYRELQQQYDALFLQNAQLKNDIKVLKKKTNPFMNSLKVYFDLQRSRKVTIRRQIKSYLQSISETLNKIGLEIESVYIKKQTEDNLSQEINLQIKESFEKVIPDRELCLYAKDKNSISDRTYNNFRKELSLHESISSLSNLKKTRKEIDNSIQINKIGDGVFLDIKTTIITRITYCSEINGLKDETIHIKFSADGTNVGKTIKMINFTFALINEGIKATTASGQYTLGLIKIDDEDYDSIQPWLVEIVKQLEELKQEELEINGKKFILEYYFAADLKLLANVLGLKQASSLHPCIWCEVPKDSLHILSPGTSIIDQNRLARSESERTRILNSSHTPSTDKGYKTDSLLGSLIPFHRCIVDTLHLKLRIVLNVLLEQLVIELIIMDNFKINQKLEIEKHKNIISYMKFLETIKINVKFQPFSKQGKTHLHRELNGTEISRFLANVDLISIYPVNQNQSENEDLIIKRNKMQILFKDFNSIYTGITKNELKSNQIKILTSQWMENFLATFHCNKVTPYIHIFCSHLHEFQELYGNVNLFNQQGLEKLNDLTTIDFFRSSNKSKGSLLQILKKRTRISLFEMKKQLVS